MAVSIQGMFGSGSTYFADSPVVIEVSGLEWPSNPASPFNVVRVDVIHEGRKVGECRGDTGGQTSISFDISSALTAIWSGEEYSGEVAAAQGGSYLRTYKSYSLVVHTEYIASDGQFTTTTSEAIAGGQCAVGHMTEWERSRVSSAGGADLSSLQGSNTRNGDASTKPKSMPERVGSNSITSWVDVSNSGTQSVFYAATATPGADSSGAHAPLVLRDSLPYADFLFLNRRGAVETCSAQTFEALEVSTETEQYGRSERPSFKPSRSLEALGTDGRRSWRMSSGYVTREWAEWWAMEFVAGKRKRWWMRYPIGSPDGTFVPVIVEPAKKQTTVYDRSKQQYPSVEFTVTMALEG